MGQLTIRHNLSPNPRRNPNPNRKPTTTPSPLTGPIKILRRGEPPTPFLERETPLPPPPPPSSLLTSDYSAATCHISNSSDTNNKKKTRNKKTNKKKVGFRDCDDVELFYSATCRLGPEPDMVPIPLSLLRKALF